MTEEEESSILDRLHSCIFLLLEAADREVDGRLNIRGHQELSEYRSGKKGKSRKSLSSSQHGSSLAQGRRNIRSNPSPSGRQDNSQRPDASSLGRSPTPDIDSWNDFPPIGAHSQGPTPEPALR